MIRSITQPGLIIARRAFTLIELLVVIAVISLLVSILMPSMQKARELARLLVCETNVRSVTMGTLLYAEDHNQNLPPLHDYTQGNVEGHEPYGNGLLGMYGYVMPQVFYSPDDTRYGKPITYETYAERWAYLIANKTLSGTIHTSYQLREPDCTTYFDQLDGTTPLTRLGDDILTVAADRFANGGGYLYSFHNGTFGVDPIPDNGDGWHVGYSDGHVSFLKNDSTIYCASGPIHSEVVWSGRHLVWRYWDKQF